MLLSGMSGMAVGSWLGGAMFDAFGHYSPAFMVGALSNLLNVVLVGALVMRQQQVRASPAFG
jgi:predicted MFS family arabinose efflux permease